MFFSGTPSRAALVLLVHSAMLQTSGTTTLSVASCNKGSPLTAFPACNWLYGQLTYCASPPVATGAPFVSCYCNQQVFNAIYNCESEWRLCEGNDDFDGDAQELASLWNSACDDRITFSPTTPVLTILTAPYDVQYCTTAALACDAGRVALEECSISYSDKDAQEYNSCLCAPALLSDAYTCNFLGNVSCLQTPATLTNLVEYAYCSDFMSVLGGASWNTSASNMSILSTRSSGIVSVSSSSAGSLPSSQDSFTITTPALPGSSSTASVPTPTSLTAVSDAGRAAVRTWVWLGVLTVISALLWDVDTL